MSRANRRRVVIAQRVRARRREMLMREALADERRKELDERRATYVEAPPAAATVVRFNGSDSVASPASERVTIRRLPDSRRAISRLLMLPMLLLGTIDESIPLPLPKIDDSDE